ncbi:MAG TPA: protein translocase subunit SecD [Candidatus Sulfotelmatobacter sp.]|nr:protein translocase subunit SecD [Candidatus Sulfotelmatobacter sp.]
MRRLFPFLIVAVGLAALAIDFVPDLSRPGTNGDVKVETRLGLDLQGGISVEYQAVTTNGAAPGPGDMSTIQTIIENRVNSTGVSEPLVQILGTDKVIVEVPGAADPDEIRKLVGTTGRLDFVDLPADTYGTGTTSTTTGTTGTKPVPQQGEAIDPTLPVLFSGDQIDPSGVAPGIDPTTNQRVVQFKLKSAAATTFATYTANNVGHYFAIVLDGTVVSAPVIQSAIPNGSGQITGDFTVADMNNLVTVLKYGALPVQLREISESQVSATLGADFLRQTLLAGAIGILLVFLFMLVYYRLPGAVACLALLYYAAVVYGLFRLIPVTLTLAGIAGFVLSVGMAVDANILIFERTKEELRSGKPVTQAIEAGFNRAWNSILDSNVSSLITATILYLVGSSTIRGFALVLIIGVLTSMFTAISLSRTVLRWVVRQSWARQARLFGVHEDEFVTTAPTRRARPAGARV